MWIGVENFYVKMLLRFSAPRIPAVFCRWIPCEKIDAVFLVPYPIRDQEFQALVAAPLLPASMNRIRAVMACLVTYDWGTERPLDRRHRFETTVIKNAEATLDDLERSYQVAKARALEELQNAKLEIEKIDFLTPNGRYDRSREGALAAKGLVTISSDVPVKRGRGRPRKWPPGQRAPRPSRAKVKMTATQASSASRSTGERAGRRASSRKTSGTVSPVTAAPARVPTPAPKAAPRVAAALLESTLAGGLGVDTIQIETAEIGVRDQAGRDPDGADHRGRERS